MTAIVRRIAPVDRPAMSAGIQYASNFGRNDIVSVPANEFELLADVMRRRRTEKVMAVAETNQAARPEASAVARAEARLAESIRVAGWAPFHYDRAAAGIAEPWRVHWLRPPRCIALARALPALIPDLKPGNRLGALLEACGALVLVNWLPESGDRSGDPEKRRRMDEEHLAAAASYAQNLLLLATAAGMGTFWSSGTLLRHDAGWQDLAIPVEERLLAAVFVDYAPDVRARPVERVAGSLREKRSDWTRWSRIVE